MAKKQNWESSIWTESTDDKTARIQEETKQVTNNKRLFLKFKEKQYRIVGNINELLGILPKKDEQYRLITQKSFNAITLLLYILKQKTEIEDCYVTTYNINKNNIEMINELLATNQIKKMKIGLSASMFFRLPVVIEQLKKLDKLHKSLNVVFFFNHTKIILVKTKKEHFVIEGSGNFSNNARVEQYLFEECEETYNFHKSWIDNVKSFNENEYKKLKK